MTVVNPLGSLLLLEIAQKGGGCPSLEKLKVRLDRGLMQLKMSLLMAEVLV